MCEVLFLGRNYFPGLEGVPVRENKKVIFLVAGVCSSALLPAPVLSAGEQADTGPARQRSALAPAGVSLERWRAVPASAAQSGPLQGSVRTRKILKQCFWSSASKYLVAHMSEPELHSQGSLLPLF